MYRTRFDHLQVDLFTALCFPTRSEETFDQPVLLEAMAQKSGAKQFLASFVSSNQIEEFTGDKEYAWKFCYLLCGNQDESGIEEAYLSDDFLFCGFAGSNCNNTSRKKKKKSKKKKNDQEQEVIKEALPQQQEQKSEEKEQKHDEKQDKNKKKQNKKKQQVKQAVEEKKQEAKPAEDKKQETSQAVVEDDKQEDESERQVREIDEHMDHTVRYARVLRIKPEEEDDWEPVPYEDGWNQVKTRRPTGSATTQSSSSSTSTVHVKLDKKQRENAARKERQKAAKAEAEALRLQKLRAHQKQLEKLKIEEFYSKGKGKNSPWGKNKTSSKVPQSTASINEHGQLIWD
ncbi:hypothetical protein G6F68_002912 [Rhizopus microsporus]|nr:hypothetical protein G6F68_002912 [Rhizopus microsporus]